MIENFGLEHGNDSNLTLNNVQTDVQYVYGNMRKILKRGPKIEWLQSLIKIKEYELFYWHSQSTMKPNFNLNIHFKESAWWLLIIIIDKSDTN